MAARAGPHEIPITPQKRGSCDANIKLLITYDNDPHATKIPSRFQTATLVREDK